MCHEYPPSSNTENYINALEVTKIISAPAVGFVTVEKATNSDINRQNNIIIELLLTLNKKLDLLLAKPVVTESSEQVEALAKQLEGLKLTPVKKKKEPFYVYRDPLKIFEEEKEKLNGNKE